MINYDDLLDNLFSQEEFDLFNHLKNIDVESLRKLGNVEQIKVTENGITQDTITFKSFDGKHSFVKTNSYFEANARHERVKELNQQIANASNSEDYLLAAKLKNEKDELLHNV